MPGAARHEELLAGVRPRPRSPKRWEEVLQDLEEKKPKVVVMAFPCSPWSNRTYFQRNQERVRERQLRERVLLRFVAAVAKVQERHGGAWLAENPKSSRA